MTFKRLTVAFALSVFFVYAGLILCLLYFCKGSLFLEALHSARTLFSLKLSFITATAATAVSVLLAVPSAYGLSRYRFFGRQVIDTILELPLIVSPIALGALVLMFFTTPLGCFLQDNGFHVVFTVYGILLAQFVTTVGIATRLVKAAMDEIPTQYEAVAQTLGASSAKAFLTITLPLSRRGIIASAILTWAKAFGEFGATITIAGSMAMKTETLPVAIFMRLASADIEGTAVLVLILLSLGLGLLYGVRLMAEKQTCI